MSACRDEARREAPALHLARRLLTVSGERKLEKEEKGKKFHRIERAFGAFARSFTLPDGTDAAKVNAEFKDGVLKVHLPKSEQAKPKALDIKVS